MDEFAMVSGYYRQAVCDYVMESEEYSEEQNSRL